MKEKTSQLFHIIKNMKAYYIPIGYLIIIFIAITPFLANTFPELIKTCLGCNINQNIIDDCVRIGIPFGTLLKEQNSFGWFFLFSLPFSFLMLILWTIYSLKKIIKFSRI